MTDDVARVDFERVEQFEYVLAESLKFCLASDQWCSTTTRQIGNDDIAFGQKRLQAVAPDMSAAAKRCNSRNSAVEKDRHRRAGLAATEQTRFAARNLDMLFNKTGHKSPIPVQFDEAGEQSVEPLRMLTVAEMPGVVDDMNLGLALMRADHVKNIQRALNRDSRVIAAKNNLGRALQPASRNHCRVSRFCRANSGRNKRLPS